MAACTRGTMFPSTLNNRSSLADSRCTQNPTLACTLAKKDPGYKLVAQMRRVDPESLSAISG